MVCITSVRERIAREGRHLRAHAVVVWVSNPGSVRTLRSFDASPRREGPAVPSPRYSAAVLARPGKPDARVDGRCQRWSIPARPDRQARKVPVVGVRRFANRKYRQERRAPCLNLEAMPFGWAGEPGVKRLRQPSFYGDHPTERNA